MPQPVTARGPLVWRDMDQKALDDAYDQDVYAPNRPLIVARRIAASERARAILGPPQRVAYGPSEYEGLDIFRAAAAKRAHQRVRPWRRLAPQQGGRLCLAGRAFSARRRPRRHHRFHQCRSGRRRSFADVRAGAPRARLDVAQRRKFWRRSRAVLYFGAFVGLASCGLLSDRRLARGRFAENFLQRRAAAQRHVRTRAGAALEALVLRQVHRRDGGEAQRAAPSRRPAHAAHPRLRHLRDAGIPAPDAGISSPRCRLSESPPN